MTYGTRATVRAELRTAACGLAGFPASFADYVLQEEVALLPPLHAANETEPCILTVAPEHLATVLARLRRRLLLRFGLIERRDGQHLDIFAGLERQEAGLDKRPAPFVIDLSARRQERDVGLWKLLERGQEVDLADLTKRVSKALRAMRETGEVRSVTARDWPLRPWRFQRKM